MSDVDSRIKKVMAGVFGIAESSITDTTSPSSVASWDSLNHIHFIMGLESEFGVSFEPEQALTLTSLPAIRSALPR